MCVGCWAEAGHMSAVPVFLNTTVEPFAIVTFAGENPASLYIMVTVVGVGVGVFVGDLLGLTLVDGDVLVLGETDAEVEGETLTDSTAVAVGEPEMLICSLSFAKKTYPNTTKTITTITPITIPLLFMCMFN